MPLLPLPKSAWEERVCHILIQVPPRAGKQLSFDPRPKPELSCCLLQAGMAQLKVKGYAGKGNGGETATCYLTFCLPPTPPTASPAPLCSWLLPPYFLLRLQFLSLQP